MGGVVAFPNPELPVMRSLLNASTSKDALPGPETFVGDIPAPTRPGCSMVSKVLENGLAGACMGFATSSSSPEFEFVLSNGSSSLELGVGGLMDIV